MFQIRQAPRKFLQLSLYSVLIFASACLPLTGRPTPAEDIDRVYTQGAETMIARMTQENGETAIAQGTQVALLTDRAAEQPPTDTLPPPPAQPTLTDTIPAATDTPIPPTETATAVPCDRAQFLMDVTIPPDSSIPTGATFTKTWRIQNVGSCTWTQDYVIVLASGSAMGNITVFSVPGVIPPAGVVDISVFLTAPATPGFFEGYWMLRNPTGSLFGAGPAGNTPFPIRIRTVQLARGNYDFDLLLNYCAATWRSAAGPLACPGNAQDSNGAVVLVSQPVLETGESYANALLTRPNQALTGWISGQYPLYTVRDQDHFLAEIGCQLGSQGCDMNFQVDFLSPNGQLTNLGAWREIYDGLTTQIDIDLSVLAGRTGNFILTVTSNTSVPFSDALWFAPRIQNLLPSTNEVLTWTLEGRSAISCDELRVYRTSQNSAEARAYACGNPFEIGRTTLTFDEVAQLLLWIERLADFEAEYFRAAQGEPLISWIEFNGSGVANASDRDIEAINNFAVRLFSRMTGF